MNTNDKHAQYAVAARWTANGVHTVTNTTRKSQPVVTPATLLVVLAVVAVAAYVVINL